MKDSELIQHYNIIYGGIKAEFKKLGSMYGMKSSQITNHYKNTRTGLKKFYEHLESLEKVKPKNPKTD
jgi:hypothetical protein